MELDLEVPDGLGGLDDLGQGRKSSPDRQLEILGHREFVFVNSEIVRGVRVATVQGYPDISESETSEVEIIDCWIDWDRIWDASLGMRRRRLPRMIIAVIPVFSVSQR